MPARDYRTADYLKTPEDIAEYLDTALEDGEPAVMLLALRNAVDAAGGVREIAARTGLNRETLYRTLSEDGNPTLSTLSALFHALGVRLSAAVEEKRNEAA